MSKKYKFMLKPKESQQIICSNRSKERLKLQKDIIPNKA